MRWEAVEAIQAGVSDNVQVGGAMKNTRDPKYLSINPHPRTNPISTAIKYQLLSMIIQRPLGRLA